MLVQEHITAIPDNLEALFEEIQNRNDPSINLRSSVNQYMEIKAREKGIPLHGSFELTPLCNLDCKMCYVHLTTEQLGERNLLTVEQWKSLIKQAFDAGMIDATLTGGECLIYPGFDEIYLYLQELGIRVSVLTNGILLNKERISFFKKHRVNNIQITLYGSNNDIYQRITGHRVFDTVMENILSAIAEGLRIKVGITPSRYMETDDEQLIRMLIEKDIPFSINSNLFSSRPETGRSINDFDQPIDEYIRLRLFYSNLKGIALPSECDSVTQQVPIGLQCGGGNSGFSIDWSGNMYACSMLPDICAQPLKNSFRDAWMSINKSAQSYPNPIECGSCKYRHLCTACAAVHRTGAMPGHANKRICSIAQRISEINQNVRSDT